MRVLTLLLLVIVAGCRLPFDGMCIDERRILYLEGSLESSDATGAATGTVSFSVHEVRNHRTKRDRHIEHFSWSVRATGIAPSAVSAVHLHERDTNLVLVELPLENATALPDVITQRTGGPPPNAALPWSDVYDLLGAGRVYLDVHIGGSGHHTMRADLAARNPNWQQFIHSSCS
jgi:hypothetical protein